MARTIESIMDARNAAETRRKAGLHIWKYRVRIKHLLEADWTDETVANLGQQMAHIIDISSWAAAERLEAAQGGCTPVADLVEELRGVEDMRHFDQVLDELYDQADADRAWIG